MNKPKALYGFHSITARLRHAPASVHEIYVESARKDRRMLDFLELAKRHDLRVIPVDRQRLDGMAKHQSHQGVVAMADEVQLHQHLNELLEDLQAANQPPFLLVLDQITDPHNLGACLRVADGVGVHAVIAPRDRSVGLNATAAKVASGAAESVPYITVTNLARTLRELKELGVRIVGTDDAASKTLYQGKFEGPIAWVLGAEGEGMRRLTRELCDELVRIPMVGSVESLNVSVASAVCLYETARQRGFNG